MPRKKKVVKPRVPRTRGNATMTEAQFWGFVRSGLRSKSQRWPPKFAVLQDAKRTVKGKRHKYEYQCALCKKWNKMTEVSVDHIVPVGTLRCYNDLPGFVERLFCEKEGLQVLCRECHNTKTQEERK